MNALPEMIHMSQPPSREQAPIAIHTLGKFAVSRNGQTLSFGRKPPRRPIALLKAIVAQGGRPVSGAQLCASLWPDAGEESARKSLLVTVFRLRKLLGDTDALVTVCGQYGFDPDRCWVDAWVFQSHVQNLQTADVTDRDPDFFSCWLAEAEALYQGGFLEVDHDTPSATTLRERLRDNYSSALKLTANAFWAHGRNNDAVATYLRAIEVSPLAEDCYRALMACYAALDRRTEAMLVYERCRLALRAGLGLGPAASTQGLYRAIYHEHHVPAPHRAVHGGA